jgi:uncharacterized protein
VRIVLDTNVVVSGLLWRGLPRDLLLMAREGSFEPVSSIAMLAELTRILARPKFAKRIAASGVMIDDLVDGYAALATIVRPLQVDGIAPDPDDDVVIGTALGSGAELIVTGDKPLLGVGRAKSVDIVTVADAVVRLREAEIWE